MDKRLRILHCLRAPVGGLFRHVRDLAHEQAARGHAVGVVCDASAHDPLTAVRLGALEPDLALGLVRLPMSRDLGPADWRATRSVRELAGRHRVDILHGHGAKGGAYARFAAQGLSRSGRHAAAFYTPHGGSLHYDPASLIGRAYMAAERHMVRMTSGIIFESAYAERVFCDKVGVPACPTRIIHNGLGPDELATIAPGPDAADVLFVGELRRLKGVDLLIEAMAVLRHEVRCRAVIVGAGPDEGELRRQADAAGLAAAITFAGAMPAREAFRLGRILVMPSRAESFPYVALEGAAAGLPLIASCVGGLPEIVEGTDTALFAPADAGALAAALRAALGDAAALAARAGRLQAEVGRRFTVARMTDGVLEFYAMAARRAAA
jgi:glycosyltransferase involved in cell wall biosynthesis